MTGYSASCFFFFYVFPVIAFFFFYGAVVYTLKKRQVGILISAYSSVKVIIDVFFSGKIWDFKRTGNDFDLGVSIATFTN